MKEFKCSNKTGCLGAEEITAEYRKKLPGVTETIIRSCRGEKCNSHVDYEPIPSKESVIFIIDKLFEIIFPGFFNADKLDPANLDYYIGRSVNELYNVLAEQVNNSIRHDCYRFDLTCLECIDKGFDIALKVLEKIPEVRDVLATDVEAAFDGDPAAKSLDEIIFSYPGIYAITIYRVAHLLYQFEVPLLPRIMTEYAHSRTGIDIHPGAQIGKRFVIDHGTGVVIGETTVIGNNVRIYQGVTLGALSLPKDAGTKMRGQKRHPNIEDDVIIYSGATILGGETVIGARSIVGGNVWLTEPVPSDMQVLMERPKLIYKNGTVEEHNADNE